MTKQVNDAVRPLITLADLDESLIDHINAQSAIIKRLAELAHIHPGELATITFQSTARYARQKQASDRIRANREQFDEDIKQMQAWVTLAQFRFENAEEWKKEAALEWKAIVGRNGSEHGRAHHFSFKEPTKKELLAAMAEYERWENADEDKYASHRANARAVLPVIRKKLAAILMQ